MSATAGRSKWRDTGGPRPAARSSTTYISRPHRQVWTGAPRPRTAAEAEFLALGDGARLWLTEAAAAGAGRMRVKMADAVATAKLVAASEVDWALGHAAVNARFGEHDLASILDHQARTRPGDLHRAGEDHSLAQGTARWAALGNTDAGQPEGEVSP